MGHARIMKTLAIEPLTKEAFAASGDVIELEGAKQIPINLARHDDPLSRSRQSGCDR
ncbi:MAG: Ureidoglycolate lyase (EC [uncultured Paraburkholderia sp.]|nr:MAG: Ureidoglycolate lyase (EC [uncultured Paraburkholderia sp.]CAH2946220.1 MAG: Ureidoglycolate lyase (EC [uncultured Paraburkholderia sp.]